MPNDINFIVKGKGSVILFLHGWGQNKEMMAPLIDNLKYKFKCVVVDLPGFGKSDFNNSKNIGEYTQKLRSFLEERNLLPKYLVGHSFGGKVCVEYYLKYKDVDKICLIASPVLRPKRNVLYYYKVYKYKIMKKIHKEKYIKCGSEDYKACPVDMRNFFVNIVNTHYDNDVNKIHVPVLLMWGNKDEKVPIRKAKKLNKLIESSNLHIVNGGHFAYLENIELSKYLLNKFIRG